MFEMITREMCKESLYIYFYREFIDKDFINRDFVFSNLTTFVLHWKYFYNFFTIMCIFALETQYFLNQVCVVRLLIFYQKLPLSL